MDSRFLKIIIVMCLIFLGVLYYELDHIGNDIKPANFEIDYTITKIKSMDSTADTASSKPTNPHYEKKENIPNHNNHSIEAVEKEMASQLINQNNQTPTSGKVFCLAEVLSCEVCYDELLNDPQIKNCDYIRKKTEIDFISESYDSSINQKVDDNISIAFSGDITKAIKSVSILSYNYSKTIDEFRPFIQDSEKYQNELRQYYRSNPIMCFTIKDKCLDPSQADEHFSSDPRVIQYFKESN